MMQLRLEKGTETVCTEENLELINGILYEKAELDEKAVNSVKYLHGVFAQYKLSTRPLDKIAHPQGDIRLIEPENTIVKPELAVTVNGQLHPTWIVEYTDQKHDEVAYGLKPVLYRAAGIEELWIVDTKKETVCVYNYKDNGLVPMICSIPQRIKVGIYNNFYISYSELFKDRRKK